jgi:hypothetical protein
MEECRSLTISRHEDGDVEDGIGFTASLTGSTRPQFVVAESLDELLLIAAGMEPTRACHTCKEEKPLFSAFCRHYGRPEGRSQDCKVCERKRVKAYKKRKREERKNLGGEGIGS